MSDYCFLKGAVAGFLLAVGLAILLIPSMAVAQYSKLQLDTALSTMKQLCEAAGVDDFTLCGVRTKEANPVSYSEFCNQVGLNLDQLGDAVPHHDEPLEQLAFFCLGHFVDANQ